MCNMIEMESSRFYAPLFSLFLCLFSPWKNNHSIHCYNEVNFNIFSFFEKVINLINYFIIDFLQKKSWLILQYIVLALIRKSVIVSLLLFHLRKHIVVNGSIDSDFMNNQYGEASSFMTALYIWQGKWNLLWQFILEIWLPHTITCEI